MGATAKVFKYGDKKGKEINLLGDPKKQIEAAEHIINFPGGSFSVTRTSNQDYWVHVSVNKDETVDDIEKDSKNGGIKTIRMDTPDGVVTIDEPDTDHFAILITTK